MRDGGVERDGEVAPPWARYPEIACGSIGWRMGAGEGWLDAWHAWLSRQPTDRAWRLAYLQRYAPAPRTWARAAIGALVPDADDDDDAVDDELLAVLATAGVIGDDVGLGAWETLYGDSPPAPWRGGRGGLPVTSLRYGMREFDFWARWCASHREALASWVKTVPPAPKDWAPVVAAARWTGETPQGWRRRGDPA